MITAIVRLRDAMTVILIINIIGVRARILLRVLNTIANIIRVRATKRVMDIVETVWVLNMT